MSALESKVALITGSAKRLGACLSRALHTSGFRVVIHYYQSEKDAIRLCEELNQKRAQSATLIQADLKDTVNTAQLIHHTIQTFGRLDVLINNAASFDAIPMTQLNVANWQASLDSNLSAPLFLSKAAQPYLYKTQGCIINMVDIRATQPLKNYAAYCISKAGLVMMTKSLAKEWAPDIRVNAISPGVVLWHDGTSPQEEINRQKIVARTPLKREGTPEDIVKTALFLIQEAPYITGQVIAVDGGRSLAY